MKIRKRYYWIAGLVLIIVVIFAISKSKKKPSFTAAYTVANQDVRQTVLATGTVTSQSDLNLSFKNSGTLQKLNVSVGDKVHTGQVLAVLDERDTSAAIRQANASVISAQANYDKVVNGASGAQVDVTKSTVASAQVALNNTQTAYTNTVSQQNTAVSNAHSAELNAGLEAIPNSGNSSTVTLNLTGTYTDTIEGMYALQVQATGAGLIVSYNGLETGSAYINRSVPSAIGTKGLFITFSATGTINSGDKWTVSIPNRQSPTYLTAYNAYQSALATQTQSVSSAQGAVASAQAALDQANAQLNLQVSAARPEDVESARGQLVSAQAQLQTAQDQYANNLIIAPIDGTITSVDTKIGEQVSPQKEAIVLLDPNSLHVESDISESSITEVSPGQNIDMTLDAFGPDRHFNGTVLSIDPASTVVSGVINFRVVSSLPTGQGIKPGMTANLTITIKDKANVLAVPTRLIKDQNGNEYITLLDGKTTRDVQIQTGLVGDSYTEVTSGLTIGEIIAAPLSS